MAQVIKWVNIFEDKEGALVFNMPLRETASIAGLSNKQLRKIAREGELDFGKCGDYDVKIVNQYRIGRDSVI